MPTVQFKSFAARYPFCRKSVITPTFSSNPPFWGSLPARGSGWLTCPSFLAVIISYLLFVLQMMLLANPIGNMGVIAWPDHLKFGDCCCAPCLLCRFKRLNLPAVLWNSVEANAAVKMIHAIHFYAKSFLFHVDIATLCKRFERLEMKEMKEMKKQNQHWQVAALERLRLSFGSAVFDRSMWDFSMPEPHWLWDRWCRRYKCITRNCFKSRETVSLTCLLHAFDHN